MPIFKRIFGRKEQKPIAPIPPWEEIVDHMQGQQLSGFADEVVKAIVSLDRSKRILILQSKNGYYIRLFMKKSAFTMKMNGCTFVMTPTVILHGGSLLIHR